MSDFFLHPHTLSGLAIMLVVVSHLTLSRTRALCTIQDDIRVGLGSAALAFLFYCSLMLQDGQLMRPHPVVWRLVHGMTLLYLAAVVFLLAQSSEDNVNFTLRLFEPRAGTAELPKLADEALTCSLTWPNIWGKVDVFFAAHFFGWFVKALILRDWGLMWTCSLMFEVLELTFQDAIPNFKECWWDRWIFDVFGCNLLGMVVGMRFAQWLGAREFDWSGKRKLNRVKRVALHFTPRVFPRRFDWHAFSSWKRFGVAALVVFGVMLGELNGFFLKSALRIPTDSHLNALRVVLMVPAVYAENLSPRIGQTAWLVIALGVLEFLLAAKNFKLRQAFRADQLQLAAPVRQAWTLTLVMAGVVALARTAKLHPLFVKVLARLTPMPLLYILLLDGLQTARYL
jgi:hypothetical protein